MSQTDLNVANASGAAVRSDINAHLDALVSLSSGATAPSTTFPNQWWLDTSTNILKQRDNANTAWVNTASKSGTNWIPYRNGITLDPPDQAEAEAGTATTERVWTAERVKQAGGGILATEQATTSGTSIDFTGIPSWVKKITITLDGVSTNAANSVPGIQIGDSGGLETSGYVGNTMQFAEPDALSVTVLSNRFLLGAVADAAATVIGHIVLTLMDAANNTWIATGNMTRGDVNANIIMAGIKSLTGTLDRLSLISGSADTFDLGAINIMYE